MLFIGMIDDPAWPTAEIACLNMPRLKYRLGLSTTALRRFSGFEKHINPARYKGHYTDDEYIPKKNHPHEGKHKHEACNHDKGKNAL